MPEKLPFEFLFTPEFSRDPYAVYASLREQGPIFPIDFPPGFDAYLIIDHEHGRAALNDPRLSKDMQRFGDYFKAIATEDDILFDSNMLSVDPPDHTRLRRIVSKAFTPRRVEELRPRVQAITDELIDGFEGGAAELIDEFAFPLPIIVICELLGIPSQDRDQFREWSSLLVNPTFVPEEVERRRAAARATTAYFRRMCEERRQEPRDDLISALVAMEELTEKELISTLSLLLIAGHETTVNLIGNGVLALLRNPDQLDLLRAKPELLPNAIEEFLRYDGPVERSTPRFASEDLEIAGTRIPRGAMVHVSIGAVGRDPEVFAEPDRLDITRTDNRHVAFGHGIHFCLGAPLARLEGQIAIGTLLERLPQLALGCAEEELSRRLTGSVVRGLSRLPIRF
ncbi:cytochrome P450 family protein [Nonomuraea dietziae]|uniref:Cytochrome P450 n=1 Tax=Nonomuraea dietziae TaxID=65515 RepID=M4JVN4_9ACTN|nr:cytochrome P450 [Nonomuraea dietziae]AGE14543.1 cytochrome P450 hydroxylase sb3-2 [Nonomuraea dietziae]MBB3733684.1 cytochrome P450 [Nonomuraea dietziae]